MYRLCSPTKLLIFAASVSSVSGVIPWAGPRPNALTAPDSARSTKQTTESPFDRRGRHLAVNGNELAGLRKRQDQLDICGWEDADQDTPIYCSLGYQCAQDQSNFGAGCCTTAAALQSCYLPTQCRPYTAAPTSSPTPQYTPDLYTTSCDLSNPYCFVRSYLYNTAQETFYEVGCTSAELPDQTVYDTYNGQPPAPSTRPDIATISVTVPNTSNGGAPAVIPSATTLTGESGNDGGGNDGGADTGAIVGGVVGGLGGLALIIGLVICCCFRRKKKDRSNKTTTDKTDQTDRSKSHRDYHFPSSNSIQQSSPPNSQTRNKLKINNQNAQTIHGRDVAQAPDTGSFSHHRQRQPDFVTEEAHEQPMYRSSLSQQQSTNISPRAEGNFTAYQNIKADPGFTSPAPSSIRVSGNSRTPYLQNSNARQTTTHTANARVGTRDSIDSAHLRDEEILPVDGQDRNNQRPAQKHNHTGLSGLTAYSHKERENNTQTSTNATETRHIDTNSEGKGPDPRTLGTAMAGSDKMTELGFKKDGTVYHELSS